MYRKLLMWLVGREMQKDDIRYNEDAIFRLIISKACDIENHRYTEDNAYGIVYLLIHSILKAIKFTYKGSKDIILNDLEARAVLGGIRSEIIAYYAYEGKVDYANEKQYVLAEAKYNLLEK